MMVPIAHCPGTLLNENVGRLGIDEFWCSPATVPTLYTYHRYIYRKSLVVGNLTQIEIDEMPPDRFDPFSFRSCDCTLRSVQGLLSNQGDRVNGDV